MDFLTLLIFLTKRQSSRVTKLQKDKELEYLSTSVPENLKNIECSILNFKLQIILFN